MKTTVKTFTKSIFLLLIFVIYPSDVKAQWVELPGDNPPARQKHTMVKIDGLIYVFGGKDELGDFSDTWAFNGDQWVNQYPTFSAGSRHGHAAVEIDGKMYVFGGSGGGFLLNDLWEYCPENNTWTLIATTGAGPSPRKGHTAVYYATTNTIYIMGGTTAAGGSSELFALDMNTKQWTQKADMLNFDVTNHGAGILNDLLIIFGGNSLFAPFSDHFFTYDLTTDTWDSIDDILGDDFIGRSDFAFTQTDDIIHVFGGTNDDIVFEDPFGDHLMIEMDLTNQISIAQPDFEPIFADGFESGDATAWNDQVPKGASAGSTKILLFGGLSGDDYLNSTWLYTECETITDSIEISICEGESFEGYHEAGIYGDTFELSLGCDSIRTLELTIEDPILDSLASSICYGESFAGYFTSGVYTDLFVASNGCDSTRVIELDVEDEILDSIMVTICSGESFESYSEAGSFVDTFTALNGCDSTRILELEIQPQIILTDTIIVADNGNSNGSIQILVNGQLEDFIIEWSDGSDSSFVDNLEAGDYGVTLTDTVGCSSDFNITVPFITSAHSENEESAFEVYPNPARDYVTLKISTLNTSELTEINMINLKGEKVANWNQIGQFNYENQLDLKSIPTGIYLIQIVSEDRIFVKKLIVY